MNSSQASTADGLVIVTLEAPITTRRLKIETVGDFWRKQIKPRIRLTGKWLDAAGFAPGSHVEVIWRTSGVLELRAIDLMPVPAAAMVEIKDAPDVPPDRARVVKIRQAWRGSSRCFFSPFLWMSDEELDQIAARVKGCSAPEIGRAVSRAETAAELLEACKEVYAWSRRNPDDQSKHAFVAHVLPKLERAIRNAESTTHI